MITQRNSTPLLSRYAESLFWMARYLERAENLARVLDVAQTFESSVNPAQAWESVIAINADETAFRERHGTPSPEAIRRFYMLDPGNPTGIRSAIDSAKQNARTLRPMISTEMWQHINMLQAAVAGFTGADISGDRFSRTCARVKEAVQLHTGITEGTFYRDQGWYFLSLGRLIERADQTTRLVDIKYHLLLPRISDIGSALDVSQWHALLRAAAGYHAYRHTHASALTPRAVAGFLLLDASFPRSTVLCVREAERVFAELRGRFGLAGGEAASARIGELRARLDGCDIDDVVDRGLHQFLDWIQQELIAIAAGIGTAFFRDWRPLAGAETRG